jgi:hypothetical protein
VGGIILFKKMASDNNHVAILSNVVYSFNNKSAALH